MIVIRDILYTIKRFFKRPPDFIVYRDDDSQYLRRWWVIPRNMYFNIYLHNFLASDEDRALHDHPWWNMSLLLTGSYKEHMPLDIDLWKKGNRLTYFKVRRPFRPVFRGANAIHRVELFKKNKKEIPVWTLFITGPKKRDWGFWCPKGFVFWKNFVSEKQGGNGVGKGCGD